MVGADSQRLCDSDSPLGQHTIDIHDTRFTDYVRWSDPTFFLVKTPSVLAVKRLMLVGHRVPNCDASGTDGNDLEKHPQLTCAILTRIQEL
jgi:hypothetical protein